MRRAFSSYGMYSIPTAALDESQIYGSGGAYAPCLSFLVRLDARFDAIQPREGIRYSTLRGKLALPEGVTIHSIESSVNLLVRADFPASTDHGVYLEFPLDAGRVAALEKCRNGGDLRLRLDLCIMAEKLCSLQIPPLPPDVVWGHVIHHELRLQEEILIPRSSWVERVLPGIGYGTINLIEMPAVPIQAVTGISHSFAALKQAQEHHRNGLYDDAVGKCRLALEPFFETVKIPGADGEPRKVPQLKASWQTRLGAATYAWLNSTLIGIKDATNKPHHSPNRHYDQFESQMIQLIATALIAYAARSADVGTAENR